jgi:hypothetical protein
MPAHTTNLSSPHFVSTATIPVLNPLSGHRPSMRVKHAERLIRQGKAHMTDGALILHAQPKPQSGWRADEALPLVSGFSGLDAKPGRAVLPPSPDVLRRMSSKPGRVVHGELKAAG